MIRVGQIVGVFGVQGAVKVRSLTDFDDRFDPGSELHVDGVARTVEWSRPGVSNLVIKLRGLDTRNDAEALRGRLLEVPDSDQRQLPDGAWYLDDLLGLAVVTESGRQLGTITEILERPAGHGRRLAARGRGRLSGHAVRRRQHLSRALRAGLPAGGDRARRAGGPDRAPGSRRARLRARPATPAGRRRPVRGRGRGGAHGRAGGR